jgi:hypothetical protein
MILNFNPFEEQESCQIAVQLGDKIVSTDRITVIFCETTIWTNDYAS